MWRGWSSILPRMYSIADYGAMIADAPRMNAFARALEHAIAPGSLVVDIGTGTGIFALLACRLGARRVYAIEPDETIQVAREIATANGVADRIEFIQAMSTRVSLPERADVIVADIGGILPWFHQHLPSIIDARTRFLAPGGRMIPQEDVGWAAVVEVPDVYARHAGPWKTNGFGLDMDAAHRLATNTWNRGTVTSENLLTDRRRWGAIDYRLVSETDVRASLTWTATRAGTAHGFAAGIDRTVCDGVYLSNAPDTPEAIRPKQSYGTAFFPWPSPVAVEAGDVIAIDLDATLIGDDYTWRWKTRVENSTQSDEKARFDQSTFFGVPLSPTTLRKRAASYTPTLNEDGRIARLVLESIANGVTLGETAARVSSAFGGRFPRPEDALTHVADLSRLFD